LSQIHYEDVSLKDLVSKAQFILVVEKTEPFLTTEEIPIHRNSEKYPPFKKYTYHFKATEELYNKSGISQIGKQINVLPGDLETDLTIHKLYYLEGIAKSPIYAKYNTRADFFKADKLILFLRRYDEKNLEIIADGAYEDLSKKNEIMDLIKNKKLSEGENEDPHTKIKPR